MPSNLAIDDRLLEKAKRIGHHRTKRETVNRALEQYILHSERLRLLELFGKIDFREDWDYKAERRKR